MVKLSIYEIEILEQILYVTMLIKMLRETVTVLLSAIDKTLQCLKFSNFSSLSVPTLYYTEGFTLFQNYIL